MLEFKRTWMFWSINNYEHVIMIFIKVSWTFLTVISVIFKKKCLRDFSSLHYDIKYNKELEYACCQMRV